MFDSNFDYFWLTLGLILLFYFLLLYFKIFLLTYCVFITNKVIHRKMIHSVVRSPCSYFDVTPSGTLTNRFSSDLGILDDNLAGSLSVFIEGPISILVVMISICQAYVYFIPIVFSLMILSMLFYKYYK
jgi:ABC-type multidrug transport system fused ATPase/permease subunit